MARHLSFVIKSAIQVHGTKQVLIPQAKYGEVCMGACVHVCVCFNGQTRLSMLFDQ